MSKVKVIKMRMPLRCKLSKSAHSTVNRIARRISPPPHEKHAWIWKLNGWVSRPWINWYIERSSSTMARVEGEKYDKG